jgi:hypothetical protein
LFHCHGRDIESRNQNCIRKGKSGKPNEFGKLVELQEAENPRLAFIRAAAPTHRIYT